MRCAPARSGWRAAAALQDYGRLVKTEFLLRYLTRPPERRVIHRQLNKHESITALEDAVFYGNEGHIRLQTLDRQSTQAAALGLVSSAIVTWNTHHMNEIQPRTSSRTARRSRRCAAVAGDPRARQPEWPLPHPPRPTTPTPDPGTRRPRDLPVASAAMRAARRSSGAAASRRQDQAL